MNEEKYIKLAHVLNTLPNGFPATESGVEIRLLKRIFRPEDVELFCELRLDFETPEQISVRTGRPLEGLEDQLMEMSKRGQVFMIDFGEVKAFKCCRGLLESMNSNSITWIENWPGCVRSSWVSLANSS
jgi:Na+-translocating ferredoxin:NAD+ oxidoreductase subunit B